MTIDGCFLTLRRFDFVEHFAGYDVYVLHTFDYSGEHAYTVTLRSRANMVGRHWNVQVDNPDMDTVCSADIDDRGEFNTIMQMYQLNYRL